MYTYRQIFLQALKITWHNPGLWIFGFFVALLGGAGGLELLLGGYSFGGLGILFNFLDGLNAAGIFTAAGFTSLTQGNPLFIILFLLILLFLIGVTLGVIWLFTISQATLVSQTLNVSKGKKFALGVGFKQGLDKFWPVLGLNAIIAFIAWFLFYLSGLSIFARSLASFVLIVDVFLVIIVIASFLIIYAICGVVLANQSLVKSLKSAWKLFTKNWLLSLEIAILLLITYFLVNSLILFVLNTILVFIAPIFGGFLFGLIVISLVLLILFLLSQSLLIVFYWSVWTIVYELLTNPKVVLVSRLKSLFKKKS